MIDELITLDTRNLDFVETYFCRAAAFKYSFFLYSISEWDKLDAALRKNHYRSLVDQSKIILKKSVII